MKAIVLAGGLGTRLANLTKTLPKPMVPIREKPFLEYVLEYLRLQGIKKIILSIGYLGYKIVNHFGNWYEDIPIIYNNEDNPLGTGGAIKKSLSLVGDKEVFVMNGDTFFAVSLKEMSKFHKERVSNLTIGLKFMNNFKRYGAVDIDKNDRITGFKEKKYRKEGLINGGIYLLKKDTFCKLSLPDVFSFEKDFIEKYVHKLDIYGFRSDSYFIDVGSPKDYLRAKNKFNKVL